VGVCVGGSCVGWWVIGCVCVFVYAWVGGIGGWVGVLVAASLASQRTRTFVNKVCLILIDSQTKSCQSHLIDSI
jgi:hypothetical protein